MNSWHLGRQIHGPVHHPYYTGLYLIGVIDHQKVEISTLHLGFCKTQNSRWCFPSFGLFPLACFTDCWGVASHLLGCSLLLAALTIAELQVSGIDLTASLSKEQEKNEGLGGEGSATKPTFWHLISGLP